MHTSADAIRERGWRLGCVKRETEDDGAIVAVPLGEDSRFGVIAPNPLRVKVIHGVNRIEVRIASTTAFYEENKLVDAGKGAEWARYEMSQLVMLVVQ